MKKILLTGIILLLITAGGVGYFLFGSPAVHPVIKNFGPVFDVPYAGMKPDSTLQYNIVADCGELKEKPEYKPDALYMPFQHIARMYNLHIYGGVPVKNLNLSVVIWGDPIYTIMNNEAYHKKYGVDNPSLKIIDEMTKAGIKFYACGQTMSKFGVDPADVNPNVVPAISRFTTVSTMQLKGSVVFRF